jgi:hypothetical protein
LFGLFNIGPAWLTIVLLGLVIGAAWGGVFGLAAHRVTPGHGNFLRYDVYVDASRHRPLPYPAR